MTEHESLGDNCRPIKVLLPLCGGSCVVSRTERGSSLSFFCRLLSGMSEKGVVNIIPTVLPHIRCCLNDAGRAFKWLKSRCNNEHHATSHILAQRLSHISEAHVDNLLNEQLSEAPRAAGTLALIGAHTTTADTDFFFPLFLALYFEMCCITSLAACESFSGASPLQIFQTE